MAEDQVLMECYRTRYTCDARRAAFAKEGKPWTPCRAVERASCFAVRNADRHLQGFHCYETERDCAVWLASYKQRSEGKPLPDEGMAADEFPGDCEWTAGVDLPARTRAVATVGR